MVISLDFELYWGLKDKRSLQEYGKNITGVRKAIPAMLELFARYNIHATWATVGLLFAEDKSELESFSPQIKPEYTNSTLSPYPTFIHVGEDEDSDPYHYGKSLIRTIKMYPGQELGTHTFSHYYCLEHGQSEQAFLADLKSAVKIAKAGGDDLCSLVFPRNQFNHSYLDLCQHIGIKTYRGNQGAWIYRERNGEEESILRRLLRLLDSYINISGHHTFSIDQANPDDRQLLNIPASRFLRPYSNALRAFEEIKIKRIKRSLKHAAKTKSLFHLWWHPHNFGVNLKKNLENLEEILRYHRKLKEQYHFESLNMREVYAASQK